MSKFTKEEVISAAKAKYGKPVSIDLFDDAMTCDTLEEAALVLVLDSAMWDSPTGDPFDTINS